MKWREPSLFASRSPNSYLHNEMRILFVDDEELLRECMYETLSHMGYDVTVEDDGRTAVERFRHYPWYFDLILTDLLMLDITGDRISEEVHAIRPDVPVVVMTGSPDHLTGKIEAAGIRKILPKPLTRTELGEALRDISQRF